MTYIFEYKPWFSGGIWLASVFFVLALLLPLLIPRYNLSRFIKVPENKGFDSIYAVLYYVQIVILAFQPFSSDNFLLYTGIIIYILGLLFYTASLFVFAVSEYDKPVCKGPYRLSRHPVYLAVFMAFLGASLAVSNILLASVSVLYYVMGRKRARAEEIQCTEIYGEAYTKYLRKVSPFP